MVLMIDDDRAYRAELSRYIRSNGFDSLESDNFAAALEFAQAYGGVCVIVPELTVGSRHLFDYIGPIGRLPGASILVLSSRREETERIVALELGADDFIPKTTERREILARIRAAARRLLPRQSVAAQPESATAHDPAHAAGSWQFLRSRRELIDPDGRSVRLTAAEFNLLHAFVENTGRPLSRAYLATIVLGRHTHDHDRGIDNLVAKLRRKLRDSARLGRMIKTARPVGYIFTGFSTAEADHAIAVLPRDARRNRRNSPRVAR
jgi:two-component system OmpR family response regulator